ncbi:hypothetical protein ACLK19_18275 [Escherichia coli]
MQLVRKMMNAWGQISGYDAIASYPDYKYTDSPTERKKASLA